MLHLPLRTVEFIRTEFEKKLVGYRVEEFRIDEHQKCLLIEDSLVLYVGFFISAMPVCCNAEEHFAWTKGNKYMDMPQRGKDYYELHIEELTYNDLGLKHNHAKFLKEIEEITQIKHVGLDVRYAKFRGFRRPYWSKDKPTLIEEIDETIPELDLKGRYKLWLGLLYNFVVMEVTDASENKEYAVGYTTSKPHTYVLSKAEEWIRSGFQHGEFRQTGRKFSKALGTWKGVRRQAMLEEKLRYFSLERYFREKDDAWRYADQILKDAYQDKYEKVEKTSYRRPENQWISEELVSKLVKKLCGNYKVICQHRPYFLKSDIGGQLSYDIYICGVDVAIEYQGKQHFEPVEYFGGEENFQRTQARDKIKRDLSEKNGVKLIYVNYWEDISARLIIKKFDEIGIELKI